MKIIDDRGIAYAFPDGTDPEEAARYVKMPPTTVIGTNSAPPPLGNRHERRRAAALARRGVHVPLSVRVDC
jgi:hypothetical protein